jgi:sulfur relay (sulfurtransferase) DsrC/TusE family protein
MKPIDITPLIKKYGPGYIAKNKKTGKVVAHSKKINELFKKIEGKNEVIISWVPKPNTRYLFPISF